MSAILKSFSCDCLDQRFLDLSSKSCEVFCQSYHFIRYRLFSPLEPNHFENLNSKISEIFFRAKIAFVGIAFIALFIARPKTVIALSLGLGIVSRILRCLGFYFQKNGFTHIQGEYKENPSVSSDHFKLMSWNICAVGGGLSLDHGGVVDFRKRLPHIIQKIQELDPDILILQEVYDAAAFEMIVAGLKKQFSHFYGHLGSNCLGSVGGLMVMHKGTNLHFSYTPFLNNSWTLNRGFARLEIPCEDAEQGMIRILGTHFTDGEASKDSQNRQKQIQQMQELSLQLPSCPTFWVGDFNIERDSAEGETLRFLEHGYKQNLSTCTNLFLNAWSRKKSLKSEELIDYISEQKFQPMSDTWIESCRLIEAFHTDTKPKDALSDHHGLLANIKKYF